MKWFIHLLFAAAFILVTFFGLGPVLLADGVIQERVITAIIVLFIYVMLTLGYVKAIKKMKK